MRIIVIFEGLVLLIIGLVSMAEGLRLIIYRDPQKLYDVLGPGPYVVFLGFLMVVTGMVYLIINYRKHITSERTSAGKEMTIRVISMVGVLSIYTLLIDIVGYLISSFIFFTLVFRIMGITSVLKNFLLTFTVTAAYYIVFVYFLRMIFPRGIIFR